MPLPGEAGGWPAGWRGCLSEPQAIARSAGWQGGGGGGVLPGLPAVGVLGEVGGGQAWGQG